MLDDALRGFLVGDEGEVTEVVPRVTMSYGSSVKYGRTPYVVTIFTSKYS